MIGYAYKQGTRSISGVLSRIFRSEGLWVSRTFWTGQFSQTEDWLYITPYIKSTSGWGSTGSGYNTYKFNSIPAGVRYYNSFYLWMGNSAHYWSATSIESENPDDINKAWGAGINANTDTFDRDKHSRSSGQSVRCIRD